MQPVCDQRKTGLILIIHGGLDFRTNYRKLLKGTVTNKQKEEENSRKAEMNRPTSDLQQFIDRGMQNR